MTAAAPDQIGAFGADVSSPFVPIGVTPRYPPPHANIRADRGASWLRRMLPVVLAHKSIFALSLAASFLGLARPGADPERAPPGDRRGARARAATSLPFVAGHRRARLHALRPELHVAALHAQDGVPHRVRPAEHHVRAPQPHVVLVLRPGAVGPAHLARELRHPAGADVPGDGADRLRAVQRGGARLRADAHDQRPARVRRDVDDAVRVRRRGPDAPLHVPGLVADPGAPGRGRHRRRREHQRRPRRQVVRGGGGPAQQADRGRAAGRVGERQGRRHPRPLGAAHREPAAARAGARAALRRLPRDQRPGDGRRHRRVQRLRADAPAAVPPARHDPDDGPAGGRVGAAHLRGARRAARRRRPAGRGRPRRMPRRRPLRRRDVRLRQRHAACSTGFDLHLRPGRDRRARRAHRHREVHGRAPAGPLLRRHRRRGPRRRPRRPRPHPAEPAPPHRHGARRAVPVLGLDPRQHRLRATRRVVRGGRRRAAARGRRRRVHPRDARGLRHGRGRARLHALGRPAPAARDRAHARGQPADPRARRRDVGHRRADRAADPRRARAT